MGFKPDKTRETLKRLLSPSILDCYVNRMSRSVILSDKAYAALIGHKRPNETLSNVIERLVASPINTFGDLERHLANTEGPLFTDRKALRRLRDRKLRTNRRV